MKIVERSKIKMLVEREEKRYVAERPKSRALFERGKGSLLGGVPFNRFLWSTVPFPIYVKEGRGAYLTDVDDHRYLDLWLGDSGAMLGHSPPAVADAVANQAHRGMTFYLPTEDSVWVGEDLSRRFGLPYWMVFMTASDANRAAIKIAREITKRKIVLVFNGAYHGTLDETLVSVGEDGVMIPVPFGANVEAVGALPTPDSRIRVVEFNDFDALEKALSPRDIGCVITEPALTNLALTHPVSGWHETLREMTRRFGTLLIIDETHTIAAGPAGLTRVWNLEPDIFTCGKSIAGGFPAAIMGLSQEVAERLPMMTQIGRFAEGIGTTLSGNALAVAALRANLEYVMTQSTYDRKLSLAERLVNGIDKIIKTVGLPWHVDRLGAWGYYQPYLTPHKTWTERIAIMAAADEDLDRFMRLFLINRGIFSGSVGGNTLLLVAPETTVEDIDFHNRVFGDCVNELVE